MLKFDKLKGSGRLFFLNESNDITTLSKANSFVYKQNTPEGFNEYYGVIVDPNTSIEDIVGEAAPAQVLSDTNLFKLYKEYELNKKFLLTFKDKKVPIFIPVEYLKMAPLSWYGINRTKENLAIEGKKRQEAIFDFYIDNLQNQHLHTLSFVRTTSVAWLYYYLHDNKETWQPGFERFGYVDGLWETGGNVTVAVDSGDFRIHTSVHELGHSMSYYLTDKYFYGYYNIAIDISEKPPTEYGKTDVAEDYAESYGFYYSGEKSREALRKMAPKRFEFMKTLDQAGGSSLLKLAKPTSQLNGRFRKFDAVVYHSPQHKYITKYPESFGDKIKIADRIMHKT